MVFAIMDKATAMEPVSVKGVEAGRHARLIAGIPAKDRPQKTAPPRHLGAADWLSDWQRYFPDPRISNRGPRSSHP